MAGPDNASQIHDEDVVAVGSISNVLRRAFRDYYSDDFDEKLNKAWERNENNNENDDASGRIPLDHPYLLYAKERIASIDKNLEEKVTQASDLMSLLTSRRREAAEKDELQARELIAQGLVVKAQIPIGPSNFKLQQNELEKYGDFASSLIHAHDLMKANHSRMLDRSGNGPTAQMKAAKAAREVPGYLKTTASVSIRKEITISNTAADIDEEEYVSEFKDDEGIPSERVKTPKKEKKKPQLSIDETIQNNKILTQMQSTLQFKRNPRYDKTNVSLNELAPPFQVTPNPVEFTTYDMGGIYEQLVLIKNVGGMSGRCRILPPATAFFMIASVKYPDESGLIAPGMSCQLRIQFAPDTRADYSDTFLILLETPSGTDIPLQVHLAAHRDPPQLSIPSTLVAACCLIGGTSRTSISCLNSGGKGRFWFLSEEEWQTDELTVLDHILALQEENVNGVKQLQVGPFTLTPSEFELEKGETIELDLVYTPTTVGNENATFLVVCDNCLVKPFRISGQGCEIVLTPIAINHVPIELNVASMGPLDHLLFAPIVTNSTASQTFQLYNYTPLDLLFHWNCNDDVFHISPDDGIISQNSAITFSVTFTPMLATSYAAKGCLLIRDVPPHCLPVTDRNEMQLAQLPLSSIEAFSMVLEGAAQPSAIELSPWIVSFAVPCSLEQPTSTDITVKNNGPTNITWELECSQSDCDILITPTHGHVLPLATTTAKVQLSPSSIGAFGFPLVCSIPNEPLNSVTAWFEGTVPRPNIRLLISEIDFGLVSVGNVAKQTLTFINDSITKTHYRFSHVGTKGGAVPSLKRTNSNDSMASSRFSIISTDTNGSDEKAEIPPKCVISFQPEEGDLGPGEVGSVTVVCTSGKYPERFRGGIQCELMNGLHRCASYISARGEIQCPQVFLSETKVSLGTTYIGVPVNHKISLVNVSNLSATFKWVEPMGRSPAYFIEFDPKSGTINSKETLTINITFTGRAPGYTDVVFACQVRGVLVPLGFELVTLQKGLVLSYELLKPDDPIPSGPVSPDITVGTCLPKLNFGDEVPLFERKSLRLLIRNHSGISAKISFEAKKYNTVFDATLTTTSPLEPRDKAFQSEGGRQYKSNQANLREDRTLLSAGLGVALLCLPAAITIAAWEQAVITITALNNMSGRYVDDIIVKLETMPPVRLNATINVVGCPLSINPNCVGLQFSVDRFPLLAYGILPLHAEAMTRKVQIINTGPIPARLTWKMLEYPDPNNPERAIDVSIQVLLKGGVKVLISPHEKKEFVVVPFQIEPIERIIPKHDHASFQLTFLPQSCGLGLTRALLVADAEWLHGEQSSRPESELSSGTNSNASSTKSLMMGAVGKAMKAVRLTNALGKGKSVGALNLKSAACISLAVSGEIITPSLHLDKGTSQISFTTWSLHGPVHPNHFQTIQLVNRLATKLTFRMETTGPFTIVEAISANMNHHPLSASGLPPTQRSLAFNQHPTPSFTLGSSQSIQLRLHFQPSNSENSAQSTVVVSSGQLFLRFSQGSTQKIELQGRVLRPMLILAPSQFKFGLVHCEQSQKVCIFLSNPTEVDAHFTISHVPMLTTTSIDDPTVFKLERMEGVLTGPTLPLYTSGALVPTPSPNYNASIQRPSELVVTFAPALPKKYKSRFRFNVKMGQGFDLVLEGVGTLVEQRVTTEPRTVPRAVPLRHSHYMLGRILD